MAQRTCTIEGCAKPHRAKGYCGSHYGKYLQKDRHKKRPMPCAYCGIETLSSGGGGRKYGVVCSEQCRTNLRMPPTCALPPEHPVMWMGKSSPWPRYGWATCEHCHSEYAPKTTTSKYCSQECAYAQTGWTPQEVTASTPRQCTRCDTTYYSPYSGRIHCSDQCKYMDIKERGASHGSQWISRSRRIAIYERDNYTCWLCNERCDLNADPIRDDKAPSLDHVIPRSRGGSHDECNLRTACRGCNSARGDSLALTLQEALTQPTQPTLFS